MSEKLPDAKYVKLAPVKLKLNVDDEFVDFVHTRITNRQVELDKPIKIEMLKHLIPFVVRSCEPVKAIVTKETKIEIMNFDTRNDSKLADTDINVFMTDEQVKKKLSDYITNEEITQDCAISIWKEFKKYQTILTS